MNTKGTPSPVGNLSANPSGVQAVTERAMTPLSAGLTGAREYNPNILPPGWTPSTSTNAEPVTPGAAQFNRRIVNNQPYTSGPGAPSGGTGTSGTTTTNPGTTNQTAQDTWRGFLDWADDQDWYTGKELSTRERSAFRRPDLPLEAPKWFPGKIGELSEADIRRIDATPPQRPTTANLFLNLNTGKRMFQYGGAWFDETTRQQVTNPNPGMDTGRPFTIPTSWLARQSVPRTTEDVYREYASLLRRGLGVM